MMKPIRDSQFNLYESCIYGIKNFYVVCHHMFPQKLGIINDLKNQANR